MGSDARASPDFPVLGPMGAVPLVPAAAPSPPIAGGMAATPALTTPLNEPVNVDSALRVRHGPRRKHSSPAAVPHTLPHEHILQAYATGRIAPRTLPHGATVARAGARVANRYDAGLHARVATNHAAAAAPTAGVAQRAVQRPQSAAPARRVATPSKGGSRSRGVAQHWAGAWQASTYQHGR